MEKSLSLDNIFSIDVTLFVLYSSLLFSLVRELDTDIKLFFAISAVINLNY